MKAAKKLDPTAKQTIRYCVSPSIRDLNIRVNNQKVKDRLIPFDGTRPESIAIVGYGPSLVKTWKQLKKFKFIISCSGATKFLLEKGLDPNKFEWWAHLDVDPRKHKKDLLGIHPKVEYLMASAVHPEVIEYLQENNCKVKLWHIFAQDGESEQVLPRDEWSITGGCDAGMRCATVARVLGFTDQHIFGMDACEGDSGKHAGKHPNQAKDHYDAEYNGKTYRTTPAWISCAQQWFKELDQLGDVTAKFYGEGLIQAMAKDYVKKPVKGSLLAFNKPSLISSEMRKLNAELHESNIHYGVGGGKYAEVAIEIVKKLSKAGEQPVSLLDYGCQPLDAQILTPEGWREMGEMEIGDDVIGSDGRPTAVIGTHSPGCVPLFRVSFKDGSSLTVDENHLWAVRTSNHQKRNQPFIVKRTGDLIGDLRWTNAEPLKWRIPMVAPIEFAAKSHIVDPYIIGALIGDGTLTASVPVLSAANPNVVREFSRALPTEIKMTPVKRASSAAYRIVKAGKRSNAPNGLVVELQDSGLWGRRSWEKHIPRKYLFSSVADRISLLQGLIDTDGEVTQKHLSYSTTSLQLANDVAFLVQSLGGTAKFAERKQSQFTWNGIKKNGRPSFVVHIKVPPSIIPTRAKEWIPRVEYHPNRVISSIEPCGIAVVKGISVSAPDQLYITENCIVTHNCGKGFLAKELPFPIYEYDPAISGKDEIPRPADIVFCTDVLEHIEPEKLDLVLDDLRRVTKQVGYFVIHLGEAVKKYADGRNAHLIIQPPEWWKEKLSAFFTVGQFVVKGHELHVVVAPWVDPNLTKVGEAKFYTPNETTKWRAKTILTKEPITIEWINSMAEGEVLFDIGANVGGYTVLAGLRGVKTYAFEPEAENFAILSRNLALNKLEPNAFPMAVTDKSGFDVLHLSSFGAGGSCHSFRDEVGFDGKERSTKFKQGCIGITLDALIGQLPQPDHIKIDVDGLEHKVIRGAIDTLKGVKSLLIEVNPAIPRHLEMMDILKVLGFTYDEEQAEKARRKDGPFKGVGEIIFTKANVAEGHLIKAIERAELVIEPYPHIVIEDAFPEEYYSQILGTEYEPISKVRPTKGYKERFVGKKEFPELLTESIKRAFCKKFGVTGDFTSEALLIRDKPGYAIGPHTDSDVRILSAIFYLAKDDNHPELGTSLYVPKKKGFTCKGGPHHDREGFRKIKTIPYKPNTAFVFLKTDNSFHGVEKTKRERNVLLYDVRHKL